MKPALAFVQKRFSLVLVITLFLIFALAYPERFLSGPNISAMLRQFLRLSLFAIGPTIVVVVGSIDLSFVGLWMLGGVLVWYAAPLFGPAAIVVYPLLGVLLGFLVGFLQVKARIPSFILTLSTTIVCWGLTAWLSGGYPRRVRGLEFITTSVIPYVPAAVFLAVPVIFGAVYIMHWTRVGTYFYAIGSNEEGATLSGINTERYRVLAFVLSGLFTGLSLIILFPLLGGAAPVELKLGNLVEPLVAIVLGGTPLIGGSGGPERTLLGALIFSIIQRGLSLTFWQPELIQLILGVVMLGAIFVGTRRLRGVVIT